MTLVDSLDSILMLYAYAPMEKDDKDGRWTMFYSIVSNKSVDVLPNEEEVNVPILAQHQAIPAEEQGSDSTDKKAPISASQSSPPTKSATQSTSLSAIAVDDKSDYAIRRKLAAKASTMSSLSISLTLLSIIVAFWSVDAFLQLALSEPRADIAAYHSSPSWALLAKIVPNVQKPQRIRKVAV
jgi:high-affinity nickel-transport protein